MRLLSKSGAHPALIAMCATFFSLASLAMAESSNNTMTVEPLHIQLFVSEGLTSIDDGRTTLFFDYRNDLIQQQSSSPQLCKRLPLSPRLQSGTQTFDRLSLFGQVIRLPDTTDAHYPVNIMIAPQILKTKTVRQPELVWNDFTFQPGLVKLKLKADDQLLNTLKQTAQINRTYTDNRLVYPYDLISLISYLEGVPEAGIWFSDEFICTFTILPYTEHRSRMTAACSD